MKITIIAIALVTLSSAEETRLLDLDPPEAQQYIDRQDTTLKYAPKVDTNVPAVRFLGNQPHNVLEDIYLANQYHGQDGLGGYLYGYSVPDIAKTEKKKAGGDLRGAYNYITGDGQEIKVEYWDDGTGFHQVDNVPKILPKQIDDTPEVKAAKEEHQRIWQEQAERNSRPIENPYDSHGNYAQGPLSPQAQQQFRQNQAQQLVNQYQQQKQQFPNPGQNVHYQGDQFGQYPQQTQNVNRYQQPGGVPTQGQGAQAIAGQYSPGTQGSSQVSSQSQGSGQPSGQYSTSTQAIGAQYPSGQASGGQAPSGQAGGQLGGQASGSSHSSGQVGGQYSSGQASGGYPSGQLGGQVVGGQVSGQFSSGQASGGYPSGQIVGQASDTHSTRQVGGQYSSGQASGGQLSGQYSGGFGSGSQSSTGSYGRQASGSGSYGSATGSQNSGQYRGGYQQAGGQNSGNNDNSGEYTEQNEGRYNEQEEENGPPKGFFYSFDYPVGIIVQKDGGSIQKREGDLHNIYAENKAEFERQLQQGHSDRSSRSSSSYLAVQN